MADGVAVAASVGVGLGVDVGGIGEGVFRIGREMEVDSGVYVACAMGRLQPANKANAIVSDTAMAGILKGVDWGRVIILNNLLIVD